MGATFDKFAAKGEQVVNDAINKAKNNGKKIHSAANGFVNHKFIYDAGDTIGHNALFNKLDMSSDVQSRISSSIINSTQGAIVGAGTGAVIGGVGGAFSDEDKSKGLNIVTGAAKGAAIGGTVGGIAGAGIGAFGKQYADILDKDGEYVGKQYNSIFDNAYYEGKTVANKIKSWGTKQQTMSETVQPGGMYI